MMSSSLQDEIEDSRTSGVGRKRDLEDLSPYQRAGSVSSNEDQPNKRAKLEANLANDNRMDLDTFPPRRFTASPQHEQSQVKDSNIPQAPHLKSWNKGIQGGLRTSFGSKPQKKTPPQEASPLQSARDEEAQRDGVDINTDLEQEDPHNMAVPTSDRTLEEIGGASEMRTEVRYLPSYRDSEVIADESDSDSNSDCEPDRPGKVSRRVLYESLEDSYQPPITRGSNVQNDLILQEVGCESSSRAPDTIDPSQLGALEVDNHLASGEVEMVYPRDITNLDESKKVYKGRQKVFKLHEMLKQGKSISIEEITFRDFKTHFLESYPKISSNLKLKHIKAAFKVYLNLYYGHVTHLHHLAMGTLVGFTGGQWAKEKLAKSKLMGPPSSANLESPEAPIRGTVNDNAKDTRKSTASMPKTQQTSYSEPKDDAPPTFTPINARTPSVSIRPETTMQSSQKPPAVVQPEHNSRNGGGSLMRSRSPVSHFGAVDETAVDIETRELELALQQKYFPAVAGSHMPQRCLACANTGHGTLDCPALSCSLCGTHGNHSIFTCPQKQRCQKCRQRGHASNDCSEKLLASNAEMGRCDICDSSNHVETFCHFLWRSFTPKPEEIKTVNSIPVHCYACGSTGHYGPECGLRRSTILSGGLTWSKLNLQKYLDTSSNRRAISSGVDYSINRAPKVFSIKGKANDPITLDDSDEDATFIRPKLHPSTQSRTGNIRFEQNSGDAHTSFSGSNSYARPPNPRRQAAPDFTSHRRLPNEPARYGRERTFSPPPNYETFQDDTRYRHQMPYRQNDHRPPPEMLHPQPPVDFAFGPARNGGKNRGGRGGRAGSGVANGRAHPGRDNNAANEPKKKKKKPKAEKAKKAKAERGGKGAR